jgi:phosphohistidine phosphatase
MKPAVTRASEVADGCESPRFAAELPPNTDREGVFVVDLYLVRHGDAVSAMENPRRPLSSQGRRRVEQTARSALERNVLVQRIYHSGIPRAQETAEILAEFLMPGKSPMALAGLSPDDDPAVIQAELAGIAESILLVGHLPHLSRLAALMVSGDSEAPVTEFFPATMVCVSGSKAQWKITWRIAP